MAQNYDIKQFSSEELKVNGKIIIPTYQRGLVWKINKRKEFMSTIFKGNPFGVVLVYEKDDKYEVVDGLQRLSTMKAYMDNPLDFYGVNDFINGEEILDSIIKKRLKLLGKKITDKAVLSGRKNFKKKMIEYVKEKGKPKATDVWKHLASEIGFDSNDFELYSDFSDFYDKFLDLLKFPNILIPAIVYTGPYDELPDVFQRLNTGSVKLTKYEIFASIWKENMILIKDETILDKVMNKYIKLEESSSFDVNIAEDDLKNDGITLFEYCYAVSEILNDEDTDYGKLFPGEKKSTDPTGFELLALVSGLSVNNSNKLVENDYLGHKTPQFLIDLKNALVDCVSFLYDSLKEWITDIKGDSIPNNSTYQMYHMIVSIFKNAYNLDTKNGLISRKNENVISEWRNKFKRFAFKNYLNDIVSQFWSKNRQVSDLDACISNEKILNRYISAVPRATFTDSIKNYFDDLKLRALTRSIESSSKLLLNYYYKLMMKEDKNRASYFEKKNSIFFDIEHITPVIKFGENKNKLPISAFGNLCYLPVKDNRSKRDKTIYQYADDRPSLTFDDKFLKFIDYPSREGLEFIDYSLDEFSTHYIKLIEDREEKVLSKIVDLLMNEKLDH